MFNPISEPCSLLSEEKGTPKPPSSSLDATTEASPGRVGSTHCREAQCSSGKSTCREWDLHHSVLNQKHLKSCPPLWLCGELRKSLLSCAEGSLWGFLASCSLFLPCQTAKRKLLMLAPHKTSTTFYYSGTQVSPLLGDQGLTQASLQTSSGKLVGKSWLCLQGEGSPVCLLASVVSSQKDNRHWE